MEQINKFLNIAPGDRPLLVRAAFWVVAIRLNLRFLPFRWLRGIMARNVQVSGPLSLAELERIEQVSWAVKTMARYVPRASCLAQALAGQVLFTSNANYTAFFESRGLK